MTAENVIKVAGGATTVAKFVIICIIGCSGRRRGVLSFLLVLLVSVCFLFLLVHPAPSLSLVCASDVRYCFSTLSSSSAPTFSTDSSWTLEQAVNEDCDRHVIVAVAVVVVVVVVLVVVWWLFREKKKRKKVWFFRRR